MRHYPIRDEDAEPDHYRQCVVCRRYNAFPARVCQYCFDREAELEADSLIEDLCEPPAPDKPLYEPSTGGRSTPTDDLFRAAIAEATAALYKADYTEQVENLLRIGVVIRDRIEQFRWESGCEKAGESGYCRSPHMGPSLIDLALENCKAAGRKSGKKRGGSSS